MIIKKNVNENYCPFVLTLHNQQHSTKCLFLNSMSQYNYGVTKTIRNSIIK